MENGQNETLEKKAEEAADQLKINLPGQNLPPVLRFLALFMLAGGLSIVGSIFADIVNPSQTNVNFYLLRILVGGLTIATAYGIIKLSRWALWTYGIALLIGLTVNPILVLLPFVVLVFLYAHREKFTPSIFDKKLAELIYKIKELFKKTPPQQVQ